MGSMNRNLVVALVVATLLCFLAAIAQAFGNPMKLPGSAAHWVATAGLFLEATGVAQAVASDLFEKIFEKYSDQNAYPYGPPSRITRQIIDNPDTPIRTWIRNTLLFDARTSLYMVLAGIAVQVIAVWLV
jgi:hypothetical protein